MEFFADLHLHSQYSVATSKFMNPMDLYKSAKLKGINLLGTGDFTHPYYFKELKEILEESKSGFFQLNPEITKKIDKSLPKKLRIQTEFILSTEVSSVYKKNGKTKKIHSCILAKNFASGEKLIDRLSKIGNLYSDGRATLNIDIKNLLEICLEIGDLFYYPAHVWDPQHSLFGNISGFDSIKEAYGDLSEYITTLETGLSSDPLMNRRISGLDNITLISNSDAHSPNKLGREINIINSDFNWDSLIKSISTGKNLETIEFFPEEGKYFLDGHKNCKICLKPEETRDLKDICPVCNKKITKGVFSRVEEISDREFHEIEEIQNFTSLIPLMEILLEVRGIKTITNRVKKEYEYLVTKFGSEFHILRNLDPLLLESHSELLAMGIERMRNGNVSTSAGFDGEYGKISVLHNLDNNENDVPGQLMLF